MVSSNMLYNTLKANSYIRWALQRRRGAVRRRTGAVDIVQSLSTLLHAALCSAVKSGAGRRRTALQSVEQLRQEKHTIV